MPERMAYRLFRDKIDHWCEGLLNFLEELNEKNII